jgi:hypothetical protein
MPKHERSTFKSKSARRKMKDAVNVKGSQGAGQVVRNECLPFRLMFKLSLG